MAGTLALVGLEGQLGFGRGVIVAPLGCQDLGQLSVQQRWRVWLSEPRLQLGVGLGGLPHAQLETSQVLAGFGEVGSGRHGPPIGLLGLARLTQPLLAEPHVVGRPAELGVHLEGLGELLVALPQSPGARRDTFLGRCAWPWD